MDVSLFTFGLFYYLHSTSLQQITKGCHLKKKKQEQRHEHITLLQRRQMTNEDPLYRTGNSAQYSVITYMRKESKKNEYICMCVTESFTVHLKLTHRKSTIIQ